MRQSPKVLCPKSSIPTVNAPNIKNIILNHVGNFIDSVAMIVISGNNTRMNSVSCEYSWGEWQQCWEYNSSQISKFGLNVWIQKNIPNLFKGATNYS